MDTNEKPRRCWNIPGRDQEGKFLMATIIASNASSKAARRALPWTPARRLVDHMFPAIPGRHHNLKAWWQR